MARTAPRKLVVCLLKTRVGDEAYRELRDEKAEEHAHYMSWLWKKGVLWAGGPLASGDYALEIYSVDSLEEAAKAQRNAPHYKSGFFYDDQYFEWTPGRWPQ